MTRKSVITNATAVTVINDGQMRYPVLTAQMRDWLAKHGPITPANYDRFCDDVECLCEATVGTPGSAKMIEFCAELIEAGASVEGLTA